MPTVRMLTTAAGPSGTFPAGSLREVSDDQALELMEARAAVLVESRRPENATRTAPERAAHRGAAGQGR